MIDSDDLRLLKCVGSLQHGIRLRDDRLSDRLNVLLTREEVRVRRGRDAGDDRTNTCDALEGIIDVKEEFS